MKLATRVSLILILISSLLAQQQANPTAEAKQMPLDWSKRVGLLRHALAENPEDVEALETLDLLLMQKFDGGDNAFRAELRKSVEKLLRLREQATDAKPADLALALELNSYIRRALGQSSEAQALLAEAVKIRARLVQEMQVSIPGNRSFPCADQRFGKPTDSREVTAPRLVYKVEPEYSEKARLAKFQGTVALRVLVDVDGQPKDLRLIRSLGLGLDEKAVEAVLQWRFNPAQKNGRPFPLCAEIELRFRLL